MLSSLAYASGNVVGQRSVGTTAGPVLATGAVLAAAVTLAPFALLQFPSRTPDGDALLSLLALAVLGTALAQLSSIACSGSTAAEAVSLVTYLMPGFALVYGSLLLDEPLTAAALGGLALILAGVALGSDARGVERGRAGGGSGPMTVTLRRAARDDVAFLVELFRHEDVAPYLAAVRPTTPGCGRRGDRAVGGGAGRPWACSCSRRTVSASAR